MRLETAKLLGDIEAAGERAARFIAGADAASFVADELLLAGVERELIIVGEALFQISKLEPEWETLVTAAPRIVRLRHVLVHGYDSVAADRIWQVVHQHLPLLVDEVQRLLAGDA